MKKCALVCLAFLILLNSGGTTPARKISPSYDVYIGFLAVGECPPPRWGNPYFKKFSFNSAIRNVRFEFGDATVGKKHYDWWFASLDVSPTIATPALIGSFGEGDIDLADLCPFWNVDNHGNTLKCTLIKIKKKFQPAMKPVDSGARARLKSVLDPEKLKKYKEDEVPLVPLVPPLCVFEYNTLFYKQTEVSLEQSGGKPELSNIRFYSVLPQDTLLAGKEATFEFPFQIPEVNGSGIMTIRYFPVKRK